jgi:hypothetical protein
MRVQIGTSDTQEINFAYHRFYPTNNRKESNVSDLTST